MTRASKPVRDLHGLLAVNKPEGMVSKDVSRWLVRHLGRLHIGHVGTLDPAASGVLPILLGRATRLQDHLLGLPKTYEFDISFGTETDTLDREGQVVREMPCDHVTAEAVLAAIPDFIGEIEQTPPLYSAVKYKGKALYDYAREQVELDVPLEAFKRKVCVTEFVMLGFSNKVGSFRLSCSKGTYIRSVVRDLAEKLGTCGTLTRLVRTRAAGVTLESAYTLEQLEGALADLPSVLIPLNRIDLDIPRWRAPTSGVTQRLRNGQQSVISIGDYAGGLETMQAEGGNIGTWAKPLLLLGDQGDALGIGAVRRAEAGRVALSMRRGL